MFYLAGLQEKLKEIMFEFNLKHSRQGKGAEHGIPETLCAGDVNLLADKRRDL